MNGQRIVGLVLLIVGVVIMIAGFHASDSFADQMKHTFTGRFTNDTAWYIFGGLAMALVGLFMSMFGPGNRRA